MENEIISLDSIEIEEEIKHISQQLDLQSLKLQFLLVDNKHLLKPILLSKEYGIGPISENYDKNTYKHEK